MKTHRRPFFRPLRFAAVCMLLILCMLLSACSSSGGKSGEWDTAFNAGNYTLETSSLIPEDLSGFSLGALNGKENPYYKGTDTVRTDEYNVQFRTLTEAQAREFFVLPSSLTLDYPDGRRIRYEGFQGNARPVSLGPDGAILWWSAFRTDEEEMYAYNLFIQRDHELVLGVRADDRGVQDVRGQFTDSLNHVLPYGYFGEAEWSPDGRYVFFNRQDYWGKGVRDIPWLLDTHTGEMFPIYVQEDVEVQDEKDKPRSYVCDGRFSSDGKYLYVELFGFGKGWEEQFRLMRYDLSAGSLETVCGLGNEIYSFCEIGDGRFLCLAYDKKAFLVTVRDGQSTTEALDMPDIETVTRDFCGGGDTPVIAYFPIRGIGCTALSVIKDPSKITWYMVPKDPLADSLQDMTREQLEQFVNNDEWKEKKYYFLYGCMPVAGTNYAILKVSSSSDVRYLLLNTETMKVKRLLENDVMYFREDEIVSQKVYSNNSRLILEGTLYSLVKKQAEK